MQFSAIHSCFLPIYKNFTISKGMNNNLEIEKGIDRTPNLTSI